MKGDHVGNLIRSARRAASVLLFSALVLAAADARARDNGHDDRHDHGPPPRHDHAGHDEDDAPRHRDRGPRGRTDGRHGRGAKRPGPGGPMGSMGSERPHRFDDRRLSETEISERLEILRMIHPEWAERAERVQRSHPQRLQQMMRRRMPRIERLIELRKNDSDAFDLEVGNIRLERESRELGEKLRRAGDDPGADAIRKALRDAVTRHFEIRQKLKERRLAHLEKEIAALREGLEQRRKDRDRMIEQRLQNLTGKKGGW
ncbi:MAG: hypothetical protein CMJ18_13555 [Phycisphaeraceae bacterium]|nr:hypothetical protein [Phycisphaeraceae bacterium]